MQYQNNEGTSLKEKSEHKIGRNDLALVVPEKNISIAMVASKILINMAVEISTALFRIKP